jgi:hypothetical protein
VNWKTLAQERRFDIPDHQLEAIAPALEALYETVRPALDRDLSTIDPVLTFRPDGR